MDEYIGPGQEPMQQETDSEQIQQQQIMSFIDQLEARHAMTNIAETLEQTQIDNIAAEVIKGYELDRESMKEWRNANASIIELARLALKPKTYAGESVASTKYPLITNACIQFAARSYPEIVKGTDVVKAKVIGQDPDGQKAARGKRVCEHMSYQLLNEMDDWEEGVDQLLITLPAVGCGFKKTYYSSTDQCNMSEMVFADDLIIDYFAKSPEKASRITHRIELTRNEIVERIRSGTFIEFDIEELGLSSETEGQADEDTPHIFLEQHRWYDLDDDGYQEPYIVTVHEDTQKLVRISARFELSGIHANKEGEIVKIDPVHYFTRFLFMPSPDGGINGMGLGILLQSINLSVNTILNQLIDAGTLANRQCGFIGRLQLGRGGSLRFKAGEWKNVQATGDDIRKNLVPLPSHEPSSTLFQLLGLLVEAGKELSGITDVLSGQSPGPNVPATTTLALIEQGLQVYSAIQKRIHRSLYKEYKKIRRLNSLYLSDEDYTNITDSQAIGKQDYNRSDCDIVPVSDPSATTNMQRIMKAKALMGVKGQGLDDQEINKRYLEALQTEDLEALMPKEQEPDPLTELEIQSKQVEIQAKQVEIEKALSEQQKIIAETELIIEKIQTERVLQDVKRAGTAFDATKLNQEKAKILANIEDSERKLEAEKLKTSQFQGKTAETNTQGAYREVGSIKSNNEELS